MDLNPVPISSDFIDSSTYDSRRIICNQTFAYSCDKCGVRLNLLEYVIFVPEEKE
jgi:hypothetical protein